MNEMLSTCLPAVQKGDLIPQGGEEGPALRSRAGSGASSHMAQTRDTPLNHSPVTTCQGLAGFPESRFLQAGLQACSSQCPRAPPPELADNESGLCGVGEGNRDQRLSRPVQGCGQARRGWLLAPPRTSFQILETSGSELGCPLPWAERQDAEVSLRRYPASHVISDSSDHEAFMEPGTVPRASVCFLLGPHQGRHLTEPGARATSHTPPTSRPAEMIVAQLTPSRRLDIRTRQRTEAQSG